MTRRISLQARDGAASAKFFGWRVLAALWSIYFVTWSFALYGGAVINAQMAKDMDLTRGVLGLGVTVLLLMNGFLAPATAWLVNRIGSRLTLFFSCTTLALGALALALWVSRGWQYIVAYGVIIGMACSSTYLPVQACVALWFEKRRAFALSIVFTSVGVGGFVVSPLLAKIIAAAGGDWRAGWYFVAAMAILAGLAALCFVKNSAAEYGQMPDGRASDAKTGAELGGVGKRATIFRTSEVWTSKQAAKTKVMWLMVVAAIGFAIPFVTTIAHIVPHLKDLGHAPAIAAMSLGVLAFASIFGKLGGGFLCDRFEPRHVWMAASLLAGLSLAIAANAVSSIEIYLLGILLGLGYGAAQVCWASMVANYFGASAFASVMGIQLPVQTVFNAAAPLLVGMAYDTQGTYVYAFYAIAAFSLATCLLLFVAAPPRLNATN